MFYHALSDEVDTRPLIRQWGMHKRVILPVVKGNDLELRLYTGENNLEIGAFHISEPIGEPFIDYTGIDLVIVPGIAFDRQGNRLGRGGGYYDRLLSQLPPNVYKIGICFPYQLVDTVPTEPFDIRMDEIITSPEYNIGNDLCSHMLVEITD